MRHPSRMLIVFLVMLLVSGVLLALAQDSDNPPPPLTSTITYTVRSGDVLDLIAARYDVATDCIAKNNNLALPGRIFVGNTLTISADCPFYSGVAPVLNPRAGHTLGASTVEPLTTTLNGGQLYTVQNNDTLDTIARKLNVSLQALSAANGSPKPTSLKAGMTLVVPVGAPAYGVFLPINPDSGQGGGAPAANETVYIVQPGDVLDLIAASFNVQLQCLVDRNGHTRPWFVFPGETIVIPSGCPAYDGYSMAYTPNPNGIQGGSGGGSPVSAPTLAPTAPPPLAQVSPTPEILLPPPTVAPPSGTAEAVG